MGAFSPGRKAEAGSTNKTASSGIKTKEENT